MNFKKTSVATALMSVLFLAACSSTSSTGTDNTDPDFSNPGLENPIEIPGTPSNPIEGVPDNELPPTEDAPGNELNHFSITEDGYIKMNGELLGHYDDGKLYVGNTEYATVEPVKSTGKNEYIVTGNDGAEFYVDVSNGVISVDWGKSVVDGGWDVTKPPVELPPTDDAPGFGIDHFSVDQNGYIFKNGEVAGRVDSDTGTIYLGSQAVGTVEAVKSTERNQYVIIGNDGAELHVTVINGVIGVDWSKSTIDGNWGALDPNFGKNHVSIDDGIVSINGETVGQIVAAPNEGGFIILGADGKPVGSAHQLGKTNVYVALEGDYNEFHFIHVSESGVINVIDKPKLQSAVAGLSSEKESLIKARAQAVKARIQSQLKP